jgi:hypothetical protein
MSYRGCAVFFDSPVQEIYSVFSYMEDFFQYREASIGRRFARLLADPLKSLFFQKSEQGELDTEANRKLYQLFTEET